MAEKKYFRYMNGHTELPRESWLIVGTYGSSRIDARRILHKVLYLAHKDPEDSEDAGLIFEYLDERDLHEDEKPVQIIYGYTPIDGTTPVEYPENPSWEQSY